MCAGLDLGADDDACEVVAVGEGIATEGNDFVGDIDVLESRIGKGIGKDARERLRQLYGDELLALVEGVLADGIGIASVGLVVGCAAALDGDRADVDGDEVAFGDELAHAFDVAAINGTADGGLDNGGSDLVGEGARGFEIDIFGAFARLGNFMHGAVGIKSENGEWSIENRSGNADALVVGGIDDIVVTVEHQEAYASAALEGKEAVSLQIGVR